MTGRLHPDDIEAIARRVAELLRDKPATTAQLVDVKTIASHLGVSPAFVYEHAAELGGVKLSDSPKAPWRFDLERARRAMEARRMSPPPARAAEHRRVAQPRAQTTPSGIPLLPIKGKAA